MKKKLSKSPKKDPLPSTFMTQLLTLFISFPNKILKSQKQRPNPLTKKQHKRKTEKNLITTNKIAEKSNFIDFAKEVPTNKTKKIRRPRNCRILFYFILRTNKNKELKKRNEIE